MATSGECLFNGAVPVYLRTTNAAVGGTGSQFSVPTTVGGIHERGRRVDSILFEVLTPTNLHGRRTLDLRLSDFNDPFFLWQCSLTEEEFYVLRREQNLLVDFHGFPLKLIELLQQCLSNESIFQTSLQISPEEVISGRPASALLTIIESTSFRQIVHLSLRMSSVSEQTLKKHLSDVFRYYKEEIEGLRAQLPMAPPSIPSQPFMASTRPDYTRQPTMPPYNAASSAGLSPEDRIRHLEQQNQLLYNQKCSLENLVVDLQRRLGLRPTTFSAGIADHRQNSNNYYASYGTAGSETLQGEVNKANEIIRKLQDEVKTLRTRSRSAETASKQLEKLLRETQTACDALRTEIGEVRAQLTERTQKVTEIQLEKDKVATELEETKKLAEANEKVIEWLHQQISEESLGRMHARHGASTSYTYQPPNRISPESWMGKAKQPYEPPSSSSSAGPL